MAPLNILIAGRPTPVGVNIQPSAISDADIPSLARFDSALLIVGWPDGSLTPAMGVLNRAGLPVGCWRYAEDPRVRPNWPGAHLVRCPWAVFGNEPDLEGFTSWSDPAAAIWRAAGGKVVSSPWADQTNAPVYLDTNATGVHAYCDDWRNVEKAPQLPLWLLEYGCPEQQEQVLRRLAACPRPLERAFLYTFRAADAQAQPAYNLAGVSLLPVLPVNGGNPFMSSHPPIPSLQQGPDNWCWALCVQAIFAATGPAPSVFDLYLQVKGAPPELPGGRATFDELKRCIQVAATLTGRKVRTLDVVDLATFDQANRDGWYLIAGVSEALLNPSQSYGHYLCVQPDSITWDQGVPIIDIMDPYGHVDGAGDQLDLSQLHQAMAGNWTGPNGLDAVGVRFD